MRRTTDARDARLALGDVPRQLAELNAMTSAQLSERYRELYGKPARSNNKGWLRKKVAWRIQELAHGGLSDRAQQRIRELGELMPLRWPSDGTRRRRGADAAAPTEPQRDERLPPVGSELVRSFNGEEHRVTVLADGFRYGTTSYRSLSQVARAITGTNWNGYLFFGLQRRARARKGEVQS